MYSEILVPTDGSQGAQLALEHALELARKYDATVHALYVVDTRIGRSGPLREYLRQEGRKAVRRATAIGAQSGVDVQTKVLEGVPHTEILDYGITHGIDLVVLGTHGRTGIDHVVMGSVAERVVRHSPIPVLTVRSE